MLKTAQERDSVLNDITLPLKELVTPSGVNSGEEGRKWSRGTMQDSALIVLGETS